MNVGITGATGFIGKALMNECLKRGFDTRVLTRSESKLHVIPSSVRVFYGDLTDENYNPSNFLNNLDVLYNCAGEINDESKMYNLHVNGTKKLLNSASGKIGSWVQLSSVGAYGVCREGIITEDSKDQPIGVYEQTKTDADEIVKNSGMPFVILRPSNVFGNNMPNQSLRGLLYAVRKGLFFFIGKKGKSLVNYVHVEDVVNALVHCGSDEQALGEVFNLSQLTTVENMITSFTSEMDSDKKILRLPKGVVRMIVGIFGWMPGFPLTFSRVDALTGRCIYDSTKIQKILGFKYSMTLEEGLKLFSKHQ